MQVKRMPGDGNCLFHSLSYPNGNHRMVRACIVRHISKHWNEYREFVVTEERGDYIQQMFRPGTWGDELVLRAFSDLSERRVRVYDDLLQEVIAVYGDVHGQPAVNVRFSGCHYDVILP
jgi:hypothetical protein